MSYPRFACVAGRETYHALASGIMSECGRDASAWQRVDDVSMSSALSDPMLCARCASRLRRRYRQNDKG